MDRQVSPPKLVTTPTWSPLPPCKQALGYYASSHSEKVAYPRV